MTKPRTLFISNVTISEMNKFFNGKKYYFNEKNRRWFRTTDGKLLSHDVWDFYHSGDPILKDEVIHHKNGDSSDDRIENLQKITRSEHTGLHNIGNQYFLGKYHTDKTKQKMSEAKLGKNHPMYGKHHTDETKQKISDKMLGHIVSDETKQKISDEMLGHIVSEETKQKFRDSHLGNKNPNWQGGKKN